MHLALGKTALTVVMMVIFGVFLGVILRDPEKANATLYD